MNLEDKVKAIIHEKLGVKPEEIEANEPLFEDSTEAVEGVVAFKQVFGIEIGANEIKPDHTFNQVIEILKSKGAAV